MWPILFWMKSCESCANHSQENVCLYTVDSNVRHYCSDNNKAYFRAAICVSPNSVHAHSTIPEVLRITLHPSCTSCWIYMQFRRRQNIFKVAVLPTPFSFRVGHSSNLIVQRLMFTCNGCFCSYNTSLHWCCVLHKHSA